MRAFILFGLALFFTTNATSGDTDMKVQEETLCLAKNIYFEARNQDVNGQIAVAMVTLNRVESKYYPDSVCGVVQQSQKRAGKVLKNRCQFSWYCDGKSDKPRDKNSYEQALQVAKLVMDEKVKLDNVKNATHYHTTYVSPYWAKSGRMQKVAMVGDHIFYAQR